MVVASAVLIIMFAMIPQKMQKVMKFILQRSPVNKLGNHAVEEIIRKSWEHTIYMYIQNYICNCMYYVYANVYIISVN